MRITFALTLVVLLAWSSTGSADDAATRRPALRSSVAAKNARLLSLRQQNAGLSDAQRVETFGERLNISLNPQQADRLLQAHHLGKGYPYSKKEKLSKGLTLMRGKVFSRAQAKIALEEGFAGGAGGQYGFQYRSAMNDGASRAVERVIAYLPVERIPAMEQELEQTFHLFKRKMEAFEASAGRYAGIGVRTGAPVRAQGDAIEDEYDAAMISIANKYAPYTRR